MKRYYCKMRSPLKMNVKYLIIVFVVIVSMMPLPIFAQGDPGCDPLDPACPIDGGLSLLIAAGIGLGAKKAYDNKKKQRHPNL
jgi:hypothetical protein